MLLNDDSLNQLTGLILAAAIEVHRILGPGLLESIYIECLEHELRAQGLAFVRQLTVPITYKGTRLRSSYRVDQCPEADGWCEAAHQSCMQVVNNIVSCFLLRERATRRPKTQSILPIESYRHSLTTVRIK